MPGLRSVADIGLDIVQRFAGELNLTLSVVAKPGPIPGSYWGDPEAGLIENRLFVSEATPVHSLLHEASHYLCMDAERRLQLDTDAGGDDLEEAAVCYLQVLLADRLPGYDRSELFRDMDAWGYSFRLGSAATWFATDAEDARDWLDGRALMALAGADNATVGEN